MSDNESTKPTRRASKRSEPRTLLRFVEELSWLLSSYEDLDFRALGSLGRDFDWSQRSALNIRSHLVQRPQTAQLLVGSLPGLLTDEHLFPTNEDIVEFSVMALGINIPRWHKKSKYELIGHIVCHTEHADRIGLDNLVKILDSMMNDKDGTRKKVEDQRRSGLSWNEVIQRILNTSK